MNFRLDYHSGQSYGERFEDVTIQVSGGGKKRVRLSFREKGNNARGYASFALPPEKMKQIAYALLAASDGVDQPIEFSFEEPKPKAVAA